MRKWSSKTKAEHQGGSISSWLAESNPPKPTNSGKQQFRKSWEKKRNSSDFEPYDDKKRRYSSKGQEDEALTPAIAVDEVALSAQLEKLKETTLSLSAGQSRVLDLIIKRKSVFFTGAAGTVIVCRVLKSILIYRFCIGDCIIQVLGKVISSRFFKTYWKHLDSVIR